MWAISIRYHLLTRVLLVLGFNLSFLNSGLNKLVPGLWMSMSSRSSSRITWLRFEAVVCDHGLEADVVTSNTDAIPRRHFYICQVRKEDDCKFFRWIDPSLSPNQEYFLKKLKMDVQRALRDRVAMQDALDESVRSKTAEVEALQGVVADLHRQNRNLKVAIRILCIVIWILT
ncbi:hypothetical protein SASPL_149488 [Salvia splendens]|uniref:GRF-type domain-containing protein n=1 Tax=Salvia splendens TaxID=180675 RepID=A0A8X8WBT3_SALSN|nr:hypothetical protein SASPL_149488 [Salvia splendens]